MQKSAAQSWEVSVDTGGTFTDCLAYEPGGRTGRVKVLSSSALRGTIAAIERFAPTPQLRIEAAWQGVDDLVRGFPFRLIGAQGWAEPATLPIVTAYRAGARTLMLAAPPEGTMRPGAAFELLSPDPAPILAARLLTGTPADAPLPAMTMRLATTHGTNALLTRSCAEPILFVTAGFEDLLTIGSQTRPDLFALEIKKPRQLLAAAVGVHGRLAADGSEIEALALAELQRTAAELVAAGHRVGAVALLHADKNPAHEQRVAEVLRAAGFAHVSCSAALAPFIKILPRAETAIVDAALAPTIQAYLKRIRTALGRGELYVMTSAGGLTHASAYLAKDSLLSGPAGGIAGAALAGKAAGHARLLAFDMGGTSTDVARYDGDFSYCFEHSVGDAHLLAPSLAIESVAAGGGSICCFVDTRLRVGPASAGADPGPACYGLGGPLTVTDINLLLGRIDPARFAIPLFPPAAERALGEIRERIEQNTAEAISVQDLLEGFRAIANQRMAGAIRRISLRCGYDPREYALVAFGGAGPQHALAIAEHLGITTVLIPAHAGLLSAVGLAGAVVERFAERQILASLESVHADLPKLVAQLEQAAVDAVRADLGSTQTEIIVRRRIASLRLLGQDATLEIEIAAALEDAFLQRYTEIYGHRPEKRTIELVSLRIVASTRPASIGTRDRTAPDHAPEPTGTRRAYFAGHWQTVPTYDQDSLRPGARITGPAVIFARYSAAVIEGGWSAVLCAHGLHCTGRPKSAPTLQRPAAVSVELFTHRFESIAREMGATLQRTAVSTNVKERLDFSCGILDATGELVVNAPHIPVHLGSLGLCVRTLSAQIAWHPGDTIITNHPRFGGSHLPDVTLVSPAFTDDETLLGFVVSRAHHAEIGGRQPGSMPTDATRLSEEGVVIPPMHLIQRGAAHWERIARLLRAAPHPSRAPEDNLADLRAALAANRRGVLALEVLAREHGPATIREHMSALNQCAERGIRRALAGRPDGEWSTEEVLDDGTRLCVAVRITGDQIAFDFSGSADVHPGNLNATPAVVHSCVLYALRLLIDEPLPLNEGLMRAATIHIPPGLLNPPFPANPDLCPAVVGGNVETSQRLVNAIIGALGLAAASQGTMNNLTFGTDAFSYYETICGGCGAGAGFHGASAVHSHMTNTSITDVEVIEHRYPVRIERFAIRPGSGGRGRFQGGDGVTRTLAFLAPMSVSLLTQHRRVGPAGLAGGSPGQPGQQSILRADGSRETLRASATCRVSAGDRLVIETPGGGGFGQPQEARCDSDG